MYHRPRMCRTCLQMSRGDFKFVSLDSVDPLWDSNSPNLKEQLISLVPEMKIDNSGSYICTSCFIALRTAYEFKRMCQATEEKFQNHNYRYRRPFGVGPGSPQFHVTLNENCTVKTSVVNFASRNINYLQTDTSIDITEHHLYDASKVLQSRKPQVNNTAAKNVSEKLPDNKTTDDKVLLPIDNKDTTESVELPEKQNEEKPEETETTQPNTSIDSLELRKKFKLSSQISIVAKQKTHKDLQGLIKTACEEIPFLKTNNLGPDALQCHIYIQNLTDEYIKENTANKFTLNELKETADSYYFVNLEDSLTCQFCTTVVGSFASRISLIEHEEEEHAIKNSFKCPNCEEDFVLNASLKEHLKIHVQPLKTDEEGEDTSGEVKPAHDIPPITEEAASQLNTTAKVPDEEKSENDATSKSEETVDQKVDDVDKQSNQEKVEKEDVTGTKNENMESATLAEESPAQKTDAVEATNSNHDLVTVSKVEAKVPAPPKAKKKKSLGIYKSILKSKNRQQIRTIKYCKCMICKKLFQNKVQLYQHCSFIHVPNINSSHYWRNHISKRRHQNPAVNEWNDCEDNQEEDLLIPTKVVPFNTLTLQSDGSKNLANFHCATCNKRFSKEQYLKLHDMHVHQRKTISCKFCTREFRSEFWFSRHKCVAPLQPPVEEEKRIYNCNFCNRQFSRLRFMKSHRKRMHKDILGVKKKLITPNFATARISKIPMQIENLEPDLDPMKLYTISGSLSYENEEDVIEILSDSEDDSEESSTESFMQEEEIVQDKSPFQEETGVEDTGPHLFGISEMFSEMVAKQEKLKQSNSLAELVNNRRKSEEPVEPKIQCDFCGEYIDENVYDSHITEHNKSRVQKRLSKLDPTIPLEGIDAENNFVLKCHVCFKGFKRKHHLAKHIEKHENGEDLEQAIKQHEIPVNHEILNSLGKQNHSVTGESKKEVTKDNSTTAISDRPYQCCGRGFKMKAHFVRHYNHTHCRYRESITPKKQEAEQEKTVPNICTGTAAYTTRSSLTNPQPETKPIETQSKAEVQQTEKNKEETIDSSAFDETILENQDSITDFEDTDNKKRKPTNFEELIDSVANKKRKISANEDLPSDEDRSKSRRSKSETKYEIEDENENEDMSLPIDLENSSGSAKSPFKYDCNLCNRSFRQKCQLRDHSNVHTGNKPYKCEFCIPKRGFTQRSSLYVHFRRVHSEILKYCQWELYSKYGNCLVCAEVFEKHAHMFEHLKEYYVENDFQCDECAQKFNMVCHYVVHNIDPLEMLQNMAPQNNLEVLLNVESDEEKAKIKIDLNECKHEGGGTTSEPDKSEQLDGPELQLDGATDSKSDVMEPIKCSTCRKGFPDKRQLKLHKKSLAHIQKAQTRKRRSEAKEKSSDILENDAEAPAATSTPTATISRKKLRCPFCDMTFLKKIHLKKHKRTHRNQLEKQVDASINSVNTMSCSEENMKKSSEGTCLESTKPEANSAHTNEEVLALESQNPAKMTKQIKKQRSKCVDVSKILNKAQIVEPPVEKVLSSSRNEELPEDICNILLSSGNATKQQQQQEDQFDSTAFSLVGSPKNLLPAEFLEKGRKDFNCGRSENEADVLKNSNFSSSNSGKESLENEFNVETPEVAAGFCERTESNATADSNSKCLDDNPSGIVVVNELSPEVNHILESPNVSVNLDGQISKVTTEATTDSLMNSDYHQDNNILSEFNL